MEQGYIGGAAMKGLSPYPNKAYADVTSTGSQAIERMRVQQHLDEQQKAIAELYSTLYTLKERLAPVLGPEPPSPVESGAGAPTPINFTARISEHNRAIVTLTHAVLALLDRLEL